MSQEEVVLNSSPAMGVFRRYPLYYWVMFVVFAIVTVMNVHQSMLENIAHDALPYMPDYVGKFNAEGRWLNFMLYPLTKHAPAIFAGTLCSVFLFIFGYRVAAKNTDNVLFAAAFGMFAVNIPYFTMLFKWPMTLMVGMGILALLTFLSVERYRYRILLISGILLFASYPAFYFLLPLIYIHQLKNERYPQIIRFVLVWMLGYVLGYAAGQISVYLYNYFATGTGVFIHFESWRQSTPTTDLASLIANIEKSAGNFVRNVKYLSRLSGWFFVPVVLTAVWAIRYQTKSLLITLMVIVSIYASVVALGVDVPLRSGITLPLGLGMIALLNPSKWWRDILLVTLFIPCAWGMHTYNHGYNHTRHLITVMLEKHDPDHLLKDSKDYQHVFISVDEKKTSEYFHNLTQSKAFHNISNLKYHYLMPYLYQYGWKIKDITIIDKDRKTIKGEAFVKEKDNNLYIDIY